MKEGEERPRLLNGTPESSKRNSSIYAVSRDQRGLGSAIFQKIVPFGSASMFAIDALSTIFHFTFLNGGGDHVPLRLNLAVRGDAQLSNNATYPQCPIQGEGYVRA